MVDATRATPRPAKIILTAPKISIPAAGAEGGLVINAKMPAMGSVTQNKEMRQTDSRVGIDAMV